MSHIAILSPQQEGKYEEKELDLDELLDVDGELKKRKYLWDSLADCKQSKDKVEVRDRPVIVLSASLPHCLRMSTLLILLLLVEV